MSDEVPEPKPLNPEDLPDDTKLDPQPSGPQDDGADDWNDESNPSI